MLFGSEIVSYSKKWPRYFLFTRSTLTFHMAKHAAQDGTSLSCLVCEKSFETKNELLCHVNTHNRYRPKKDAVKSHSCSHCDKSFANSKELRRHMVTHTKERYHSGYISMIIYLCIFHKCYDSIMNNLVNIFITKCQL